MGFHRCAITPSPPSSPLCTVILHLNVLFLDLSPVKKRRSRRRLKSHRLWLALSESREIKSLHNSKQKMKLNWHVNNSTLINSTFNTTSHRIDRSTSHLPTFPFYSTFLLSVTQWASSQTWINVENVASSTWIALICLVSSAFEASSRDKRTRFGGCLQLEFMTTLIGRLHTRCRRSSEWVSERAMASVWVRLNSSRSAFARSSKCEVECNI